MTRLTRYLLLLFALGLVGGWHWWTQQRGVTQPPGVLVESAPTQRDLDPPPTWNRNGYTFIARARYDLNVRILRKENYHVDRGADLAPVDLAVGWGPLSDSTIIDQLEFSQMGRFFYWRPKNGKTFPLPTAVLIDHAAQMHMVPATQDIEERLRYLHPGQVVTMSGYLVDIRGPGGFTWNTSLTREDTGDGACEIFWAESISVD